MTDSTDPAIDNANKAGASQVSFAAFPDLKAAVVNAVNDHISEVTSQGNSLIASIDRRVEKTFVATGGELHAMEDRLAEGVLHAHNDVIDLYNHVVAFPHVGWIIAAAAGLLFGGGLLVEFAHRML